MNDAVAMTIRSDIAVVLMDNPPVNAINVEVRRGLETAIAKANDDPEIRAILLAGNGRCFSGGADIREFGKPRQLPLLADLACQLEDCRKPTIAAVHGAAVGGGTELSLGCHYRVGNGSAVIGLPEVKLGLIPGAGGTQRLPRLIGCKASLDVIVQGEPVSAVNALELGFFDEIVEGELIEGAIAFVETLLATGVEPRRTADIPVDIDLAEQAITDARATATRKSRGLVAPLKCIESVERGLTIPIDQALVQDRMAFDELAASDQAKAQRHLFFAQRQTQKLPYLTKQIEPHTVRIAGVIGAGTMGRGIAVCLAKAGINTVILENDADRLAEGVSMVRKMLDGSAVGTVTGTSEYDGLAHVDMVIEAAFEDMEVKKNIFKKLESVCSSKAILATNTSSLDINEIAEFVSTPDRLVGAHFFSPAHIMKLLEIVRADQTSPAVIASMFQLSKKIGKVGVVVGVCDGFVGNRMLYAYRKQAEFLLEEGALPQQVDWALKTFGFAMGPFAIGDLAGLDVGYRVRQHRRQLDIIDDRYSSTLADRIVEQGRLGQKNAKGWYRYETGSRKPEPDRAVESLILERSAELGLQRRSISDEEIVERCIYALVNEGALILSEGIANRPSDIDLIWANGYGFPIGRGGPMYYADTVGLSPIVDSLNGYFAAGIEELKPAELLCNLARDQASLYDLNA